MLILFQDDIIARGVEDGVFLPQIPVPTGNYMLQLRVGAFKKLRADVKIYGRKKD